MAGRGEGLPTRPTFTKEPFILRSLYFGSFAIAAILTVSNIDYTRVAFIQMGVPPEGAFAFACGLSALEMVLATVVLNREALGIIIATARRIPGIIQEQEEVLYRWVATAIVVLLIFLVLAFTLSIYAVDIWTTFQGSRAPSNFMGWTLVAVLVAGPEVLLMTNSVIKWIARSHEMDEAASTIRWKVQKAADDSALRTQLENLRLKRENETADRQIARHQSAQQRREKYEQAGLGNGGSGGILNSLKRMGGKLAGAIGGKGNGGPPPPPSSGGGFSNQPMSAPQRRG